MIIKTILISVILVVIVMLALGIKMLFDKNAKFAVHSCNHETNDSEHKGSCCKCGIESPSVYTADTGTN